jgi:chloramphenicol-sensitive protein RarD
MTDNSEFRTGLLHALIAYIIWGFMPLFFKQLAEISPVHVVSHRIVWAVPMLLVMLALRGRIAEYLAVLKNRKDTMMLLLSSLLIATNWLVYIYAVMSGQILAASLGYFLNPLLNVVLGMVFFKERLNRVQWLAVALAAIGVCILARESLDGIWISLTLAISFGAYGMVRKIASVKAVPGLSVETSLLFPIALGFIIWAGFNSEAPGLGYSVKTDIFLVLGGAITAIPLLFFASAAKKMPLSTLGFIQYIGPTIQFILGVFLYNEPLAGAQIICFSLIWLALMIYSTDAYLASRRIAINQPVKT